MHECVAPPHAQESMEDKLKDEDQRAIVLRTVQPHWGGWQGREIVLDREDEEQTAGEENTEEDGNVNAKFRQSKDEREAKTDADDRERKHHNTPEVGERSSTMETAVINEAPWTSILIPCAVEGCAVEACFWSPGDT